MAGFFGRRTDSTLTDQERHDLDVTVTWRGRLRAIKQSSTLDDCAITVLRKVAELEAGDRLLVRFPQLFHNVSAAAHCCDSVLESCQGGSERVRSVVTAVEELDLHLRIFHQQVMRTEFETLRGSKIERGHNLNLAVSEATLSHLHARASDSFVYLCSQRQDSNWGIVDDVAGIWRKFPGTVASITEHLLWVTESRFFMNLEAFERHYPKHEDKRPRLRDLRNWMALDSAAARDCWPDFGRGAIRHLMAEWTASMAFLQAAAAQLLDEQAVSQLADLQSHTELLLFNAGLPMPDSNTDWPHSMNPLLAKLAPSEQHEYRTLVKRATRIFDELESSEYERLRNHRTDPTWRPGDDFVDEENHTGQIRLSPPYPPIPDGCNLIIGMPVEALDVNCATPSGGSLVAAAPSLDDAVSSRAQERPRYYHDDTYSEVIFDHQRHSFTPSQSACVEVLWKRWASPIPEISGSQVIADANLGGTRWSDVFRKTVDKTIVDHPALGTMIVKGRNNKYRLAGDCPPEYQS